DVAARPGVAVPPPRPADAAGRLEAPDGQPQRAQPMVRVQAGEAGADHDGVDVVGSSGHAASLPRIYEVTHTRISAPEARAVSAGWPGPVRRAGAPAPRRPASCSSTSPAATNTCTNAPSGMNDTSSGPRRAPHSAASR